MSKDFLDELAELALGSRLKRLSERMLSDAAAVYQQYNMDIQPKWFTLLALLDAKQTVGVVEAADYLGLSQPALSQFCRQLEAQNLVVLTASDADSRKKIISLTVQGEAKIVEMKPVWQAVRAAAEEMCRAFDNQFYQSLLLFEKAHQEASLLTRTQAHFAQGSSGESMQSSSIKIRSFEASLAPYFESINRQWIEQMFVLEAVDQQVLSQPQTEIIDKGGKIWFAEHETLGVVGACALLKKSAGVFELTKMGVLSKARGMKIGELLLQHVIQQAELLGVSCLFLLTNAKCEAAIHLYEKNGFVHDAQIMHDYGKSYQRCDVAMRWHKPS